MVTGRWPQWTTELTTKFVTGEDHLGVEGAAQSYQQYLVPGIITTTDHARYYSFYAWVLYRFINWPESSRLMRDFRGSFFKRHEVALIVAAYSHHKEGTPLGGLVGSGVNAYKARGFWESGDPISLDANYFQNNLGGFGQYYATAMRAMGIIADSEHRSWVYRLTTRGERLAKAYEASLSNTAYLEILQKAGSLSHVSHADAIEYGQKGCICPDALAIGQDRELLRDAFFRFDQTERGSPHVRRRLTLGVALDLVQGAAGELQTEAVRPSLYLGEYAPGHTYTPSEGLREWTARWRMVEIRHLYTFGLQCLWAAFLLHLSSTDGGLSFDEYTVWVRSHLDGVSWDTPATAYLDARCHAFGLTRGWQTEHGAFRRGCLQETGQDEYSLYLRASENRLDAPLLLNVGLQILTQHFLRFLSWHETEDPTWTELARRERLPMATHFDALTGHLADPAWTVGDYLEWLYRESVLGQHEFIALEKLRYQNYDTFKFYYREGCFYWPFPTPDAYHEPIRLAALRLTNVLTILTDLGLISEDAEGHLTLTADGAGYWTRVVQEGHDGR